jgi:MFS superfamily sulfate permease-like transporter
MNPAAQPGSMWESFRHDLIASVVVFLIALPLCMGIAVASGAPPAAGLITGIVGGLIVGVLAGCPLQVSGPAAGLTVIVWELIQTRGYETLGVIVLAAGVLQLLAAGLQLAQWFRAVSPAVIQGMLAGIGVLLVASQFYVMIDDAPPGSGLENLAGIPAAVWHVLSDSEDGHASHHLAAAIGLMTIGVLVLWQILAPAKLRMVPPVLVGVLASTAVAFHLDLPVSYLPVRENIFTIIHMPSPEALRHLLDPSLLSAGIAVAFIASAETLLSATAVDHLHAGPRTRYTRELMAQGIGNVCCGLLGALPMTGVIVRSSANIQAGARTRLSAVLHGIWLLLFVAFLPLLLRLIPSASLAGVLVFTGYKLINLDHIRELRTYGRSEVLIYLGTLIAVVTTNLLTGVLVGLGLAVAKLVYSTHYLETHLEQDRQAGTARLELMGIATFVSLPALASALEQIAPGVEVHVEFRSLRHIDHACLNLLDSWKRIHELNGGRVILDRHQLQTRAHRGRAHRRTDHAPHPATTTAPRPLPASGITHGKVPH